MNLKDISNLFMWKVYQRKPYRDFGEPIFYNWYQDNARIYLDEYEGQEKLRMDWFENNKYFLHKNRFGQNSIVFGVDISQFQEACENLAKLGQEIYNKITKDTYFENRWMRRN